jgi:hypothetical protein
MSATRKPGLPTMLESSTAFLRNFFRQPDLEVGPHKRGATEYMQKRIGDTISQLRRQRREDVEVAASTKEAVKIKEVQPNENTLPRSLSFYKAQQAFYENQIEVLGDDIYQLQVADTEMKRALGAL